MGTNTNAYLVYGIPLEEDSLNVEGDSGEPGSPANLVNMTFSHNGLSILKHCYIDYPQYVVYLSASYNEAQRGYLTDIDPSKLVVPKGSDEKLRAYCQKYGLKTVGNPRWILCSYWG